MAAVQRRKPSLGELIAFFICVGQVTGCYTLALITIKEMGSFSGDSPAAVDSRAGLPVTAVAFLLTGLAILICAVLLLRQSIGARFGLVAGEIVLTAITIAFIGRLLLLGEVVAISAIVVMLFATALSGVGRQKL